MAYDSKYLHRVLQLHGGNLQPSRIACKAGREHIIKTRYSVVVVVSIFLSIYLLTFIDDGIGRTDCKVF